MTKIENKSYEEERALFGIKNAEIIGCKFSGKTDGESPLKETENLKVKNCHFDLRYPLWHTTNLNLENCTFSKLSRAPFWYDKNTIIKDAQSESVKVFRECRNIKLYNSTFISEEPFWKNKKIYANSCEFSGFYGFFMCKNVELENLKFEGKYSFQYCKKVTIKNSVLDTKDAFWHSNSVYMENCTVKGEYIGWYSKNLVFVNCTIESHQPFCHAKNILLINCKMPNSDLAFEDTSVKGNIIGEIESIKAPRKAHLKVGKVKEFVDMKKSRKVVIKTGE